MIGRDTLRRVAELRQRAEGIIDLRTRALVRTWARAWDEIAPEWHTAARALAELRDDGQWPTRGQIARHTRAQRALAATRDVLDELATQVESGTRQDAADAADIAAAAQPGIIASQLPSSAGHPGAMGLAFDRIDPAALEAIVRRSGQQITALTFPLADEATRNMKRALVRGVAVGDNPQQAARDMLARTEQGFNGGLTRALNIARTETLDAHRSAASAAQHANDDVLAGWMWNAKLDTVTCPACWSLHGTVWPVTEPGPLDHQQGRCSRTPKTRSWADLGFTGIDEPPDLTPDAETTFRQLTRDEQLAIMGPGRLAALDEGRVAWSDLATRRSTPGWRDSYAPRPVRDLPTEPPEPEPEPDPGPEPGPGDPLQNVDLASLTDEEIAGMFGEHSGDEAVLAALMNEMDRRDQQPDEDPEWGQAAEEPSPLDEWLEAGYSMDEAIEMVHGDVQHDHTPQLAMVAGQGSRRQQVREAYDQWVHAQYLAADHETRGNLLNRAGQAAGVDPISLFSGQASRARKYASEELKRFWQDNPRTTLTQFRAQALGWASDKAAARRSGEQGSGREFGL